MWLLYIFFAGMLAVVTIQDFRFRAVSWILFPLLYVSVACIAVPGAGVYPWLHFSGINLLLIAVQGLMLFAWFSLKNRKVVNLTKAHLGWGDILFIAVPAMLFSPLHFLFYYILSLVVALLCGLWILRKEYAERSIPLAGIQAAVLFLFFVSDMMSDHLNFRNDDWILTLIA
jgi:hypothetical protein